MSNLSSKIQTGPKNSLHFDSTKSVKQTHKIKELLSFSNPGKNLQISLGNLENLGKRKTKKRTTYDTTRQSEAVFYDSNGLTVDGQQDICDCLRVDCPGCHFSCKSCSSSKCGNKCRVNRQWFYKKLEYEGSGYVVEMENDS